MQASVLLSFGLSTDLTTTTSGATEFDTILVFF
jgi:hypothetical protein